MLRVSKLRFARSRFRLGPVELSLDTGEMLRIVGANGTGKTTLLKLLLGQLRATDGKIDRSTNLIGQVGVTPFLFENWTVHDNLKLVERLLGETADPDLIDRIDELRPLLVSQLSSGRKREVELCTMLALPFKIYLFDEVFTHLDSERAEFFETRIRQMMNDQVGFILSAHKVSDRFEQEAKVLEL